MNQALRFTTPTRWEDQGRHYAGSTLFNGLGRRAAERARRGTSPRDSRPSVRQEGGKSHTEAAHPRPPFSPNAQNLLRTVRRQPPRDPTVKPGKTLGQAVRNQPRTPRSGKRSSQARQGRRGTRGCVGQQRKTHSQRHAHPTRQTADSGIARPAVTKLPGKCGRALRNQAPTTQG